MDRKKGNWKQKSVFGWGLAKGQTEVCLSVAEKHCKFPSVIPHSLGMRII